MKKYLVCYHWIDTSNFHHTNLNNIVLPDYDLKWDIEGNLDIKSVRKAIDLDNNCEHLIVIVSITRIPNIKD